jgi:hypothetical protein
MKSRVRWPGKAIGGGERDQRIVGYGNFRPQVHRRIEQTIVDRLMAKTWHLAVFPLTIAAENKLTFPVRRPEVELR